MPDVWVIDVDATLVDSLSGSSLRPGAMELLERLRDARAAVLLWSAGGAAYARERATQHGLGHLVTAYHGKDRRDASGRLGAPVAAAGAIVYVDDKPEDLPLGADVIAVSPYLSDNPHDRGLVDVIARAGGARQP
jgi:phosphoserine phosphatase